MSGRLAAFTAFYQAHPAHVLVEVEEAKGSTPREAGAFMLVSPTAIFGTIGGGQLEFMAIEKARALLSGDAVAGRMAVPLGPDIGQCCGGHVTLSLAVADDAALAALGERIAGAEAGFPAVFLFGGGHVGHALAAALAPLPVSATIVETRGEALEGVPAGVAARLTAVPESIVEDAPPRSAFVVLTHDHSLDFLIVRAALARADAAYVGMIGSKTKRARFERWYLSEAGGTATDAARLVSPIGGGGLLDKRPEVIAAFAAAEILSAVLSGHRG